MALVSKHLSMQTSIGAVEAFFEAFRRHDIKGMLTHCNPNGQVSIAPMGDDGKGQIKTVGQKFWSELTEAFPNLSNEITTVFADLDGHVCAEVVVAGTQQEDFGTIKNQGLHFQLDQSFVFDVGFDGLIQKIDCYWDNATFYQQLRKRHL